MKSSLASALLAAGLASSAACATERPAPPAAGDARAAPGPTALIVDVATARRLVAGGIKVVDVRTPAEFATGHLNTAYTHPVSLDELAEKAWVCLDLTYDRCRAEGRL